MSKLNVNVINNSKHLLPKYESNGAAGLDLKANIEEDIILKPLERIVIPTGLFIELPSGYEMQIRPRSGLSIKHGITVINSPGTIDSDFRGEIKIGLVNLSNNEFIIKDGERVAQAVVSRHEIIEWVTTEKLEETERGENGFGSTGK
jgi:dUTP pyrophosphatase